MDIFNYNKVTGEFLTKSVARENPLKNDEILLPANATKVVPPVATENKTAVFNGASWDLVDDYRGTRYWLFNNFGIEITKLNITVPVAATTTAPPSLDSVLSGGIWRNPTASEINSKKDLQVELEIGSDAIRILMDRLIPHMNPSLNVNDVINEAKAKRRSEL